MGGRRSNDLLPHEVEIATEPIELEILSYDEIVKRFIADAERRRLRLVNLFISVDPE